MKIIRSFESTSILRSLVRDVKRLQKEGISHLDRNFMVSKFADRKKPNLFLGRRIRGYPKGEMFGNQYQNGIWRVKIVKGKGK